MMSYKVLKENLSVPACTAACPAGVDVPRHLRYIRDGKYDEAIAVMLERNPFPAVCGASCFNPCETKCGNPLFGEPVSIRALHYFAVERGGEIARKRVVKKPDTGKRVAVVGSGPSGLTAAWFLAISGHHVTVFESSDQPGGMMRYGIPEYRLPNNTLDKEIGYIKDIGIEIITGSRVESAEALMMDGFDSVYLATGTPRSLLLNIEGKELGGIVPALSFLKVAFRNNTDYLRGKVVVIGGGNVALDAARSAIRLGASQVGLACLEPYDQMPAFETEINHALKEGVSIHNSLAPQSFLPGKDAVSVGSIVFQRVSNFTSDPENGISWDLEEDPEAKVVMDADMVIVAIGQGVDMPEQMGLSLSGKGLVPVDAESLSTGKTGVFAGGDIVSGPTSIIDAIAHGRQAAESIDRYLGGEGNVDIVLAEDENEIEVPEFTENKEPRNRRKRLGLDESLTGFKQVEYGLSEAQAVEEAKRCYNCDARKFNITMYAENCRECGYCFKFCGPQVLSQTSALNSKGYKIVEIQNPDKCVGCLQCFFVCPEYAIEVDEVIGH